MQLSMSALAMACNSSCSAQMTVKDAVKDSIMCYLEALFDASLLLPLELHGMLYLSCNSHVNPRSKELMSPRRSVLHHDHRGMCPTTHL